MSLQVRSVGGSGLDMRISRPLNLSWYKTFTEWVGKLGGDAGWIAYIQRELPMSTTHADLLKQLDEAAITRTHWKIMFISGMGFFTDA